MSKMRLFVCRHGERMDVVFGKHWVTQCFDSKGQQTEEITFDYFDLFFLRKALICDVQVDTSALISTCRSAYQQEAMVTKTMRKTARLLSLAPPRHVL